MTKLTPQLAENVRVLHSFGYAATHIARLTGLSRRQVTDLLYRQRLQASNAKLSPTALDRQAVDRPTKLPSAPTAQAKPRPRSLPRETEPYDGPTTLDRLQVLHDKLNSLVPQSRRVRLTESKN